MHLPKKEFDRLWKVKPMVSADSVVIRKGEILLTKRATDPFRGFWVLPGGLMDTGETIEETAVREIKEETGVDVKILKIVGVYSGAKRDPRGTTLTVCFLTKFVKGGGKTDGEASEVRFFSPSALPKNIGFDHAKMIKDALSIMKNNKS